MPGWPDWTGGDKRLAVSTGEPNPSKEEAGQSGEQWGDDELAIITRPDLSTKEAALMLGRTYASVVRRRHLLRRHLRMAQRNGDEAIHADQG